MIKRSFSEFFQKLFLKYFEIFYIYSSGRVPFSQFLNGIVHSVGGGVP